MDRKEEWQTLSVRYDIQQVKEKSSHSNLLQQLLNVSNSDTIDFSLRDFNDSIDLYWVISQLNKKGITIDGIEIIEKRNDENFKYPLDFYIENLRFTKPINISDDIFNQNISISNCVFEKKVTFNRTEFKSISIRNCSFLSLLDSFSSKCSENFFALNSAFDIFKLEHSDINGSFLCSSVIFNNIFHLKGTTIHKQVGFDSVNFNASVNCVNAKFKGQVNFGDWNKRGTKTLFKETADFNGAHFYDYLDFENVDFYGKAIFAHCHFDGDTFFNTIFYNQSVFYRSIFAKTISVTSKFCDKSYFDFAQFKDDTFFHSIECSHKLSFKCSTISKNFTISPKQIGGDEKVTINGDLSFTGLILKETAILGVFDINLTTEKRKNTLTFRGAILQGVINIQRVYFEKITFSEAVTSGHFHFDKLNVESVEDKETARFMKFCFINDNNTVLSLPYKVKEMSLYEDELETDIFSSIKCSKFKPKELRIGELLLLKLNKLSNKYGSSWTRGIVFTISVWIMFFSLFIMAKDGIGSTFIWLDPIYLKQAISYFWLFNGMEGLDELSSTSWLEIIPFLLGKIFIGYGIYQTISAFRKYGQ